MDKATYEVLRLTPDMVEVTVTPHADGTATIDFGPAATLRHDPTDDCDGKPCTVVCPECLALLCACEYAFGHDCEV